MHVGLLGPLTTAGLGAHLPAGHGLPAGMGGTPVTLLAAELLAQGHEVTVWSLSPDITEPVAVEGSRLRVCYLPWREGGRGRDQYREERRWLTAALADGVRDVDVLNAHWTYEYAMAAQAIPPASRAPLVVTTHDWAPTILRYRPDPYRAIRLVMAARVYVRRPPLTAPSPYLARAVHRWTRLDPRVVPNGLARDQLGPGPRTDFGGRQVLCVADGFEDRKNSAGLLRGVAAMRRSGRDVQLTLLGNDHGVGEAADQFAQREGLAQGVVFRGRVEYAQVLEAMQTADVLAHPAREESFGMVLVEAMAQGLPVVAGRASGAVPWVLGEGTAGVLVDVDEPDALAAGVAEVLDDTARAEALSASGYRWVSERFLMPAIAAAYLETYEMLRRHA